MYEQRYGYLDTDLPVGVLSNGQPLLERVGQSASRRRVRVPPDGLRPSRDARRVCAKPQGVPRKSKLPDDGCHQEDERDNSDELDGRLAVLAPEPGSRDTSVSHDAISVPSA